MQRYYPFSENMNSFFCSFAILLLCSVSLSCSEQPATDFEPFREMARNASCADVENRLFSIDGTQVFWDRRGNCPDNGYAQMLFGSTPAEELCSLRDSIAGPMKACDQAGFQGMFDTITSNLDQSDLGLGASHQVQPISF